MLLTPPEAAERLRVSLRMVYALMADGSITSVRIRRAKRIDEHELQRFIESCQSTTTKRRKGGAGNFKPSSTASALLSGGHNLHAVAQVLGHKTVQSTKRYAHLYPEVQASALSSIFRRKA